MLGNFLLNPGIAALTTLSRSGNTPTVRVTLLWANEAEVAADSRVRVRGSSSFFIGVPPGNESGLREQDD